MAAQRYTILSLNENLATFESRIQVDENAFVSVDTEAELDAALAAGRSIVLRGEGSGGVITLTDPKTITTRRMTIQGAIGGEELRFAGLPVDAHAITINADDVCLKNFKLTSTLALGGSNIQSGIYIPVAVLEVDQRGHRTRISAVEMANWYTCLGKHGGDSSPYVQDITVEDCYWHSCTYGIYLTYGVERCTLRRSRLLMKLAGETHTTGNAAYISNNVRDLLVEDCTLGQCRLIALEMTTVAGTTQVRPRVVRTRTLSTTESMGVSFGHCTQGYGEHIIVEDAVGIGIEIAGSDATGRANATLVACEVRGVTNPTGESFGFTVDQAYDCLLLGCKVSNISAATANLATGIYLNMANRCAVIGCLCLDAGATCVQLYKGSDPNTGGFNVVEGCTFRHTSNLAGATQRSVFVSDTNAVVRNNNSFQRPGGSLIYTAACTAGAAVYCDDSGGPVVTGDFTGSNRIISVPA